MSEPKTDKHELGAKAYALDEVYCKRNYFVQGPGTVAEAGWAEGGENSRYASYGTYGMPSNTIVAPGKVVDDGGDVQRFLNSEHGRPFRQDFEGLKPGTPEFGKKWEDAAERYGENFSNGQYQYEVANRFVPEVGRLENATGMNVRDKSSALQNVVFSTGMQDYPADKDPVVEGIANKAKELGVNPGELTDRQCIDGIIDARKPYEKDDLPGLERERQLAGEMLDLEKPFEKSVQGQAAGAGAGAASETQEGADQKAGQKADQHLDEIEDEKSRY